MAAATAFRNYLRDVLGFRPETATEIVQRQNYDEISKFAGAKKSHIEDMCDTVRRTYIPHPPPAGGGAAPQNVPGDPKYHLSAWHARNLHQLIQYAIYLQSTNRTHTAALGAQANLDTISQYYDQANNGRESDPDLPDHPEKFDNKNSVPMMERIDNWIEEANGKHSIPLVAYIRIDDPAAVDPGFLQPDPETELSERAPLVGVVAKHNGALIWNMLFAVTHETQAWSIIKRFKRLKNGRGAYFALVTHYRGVGHRNRMHTAAETRLKKTFYAGTKKFSFSQFTGNLIGAFQDLEECGDVRDDAYRVRHMLSVISMEALRPACSHIRNNMALLHNFQDAIEYLANDVSAHEAEKATPVPNLRNLSATNSDRNGGGRNQGNRNGGGRGRGRGGRGGGRGRGRGRGGNQNQNEVWSEDGTILLTNGTYPPHIWNGLSRNDHAEVFRLRARADERREREISAFQRQGHEEGTPAEPQQQVQFQTPGQQQGGRGRGYQNGANFRMTYPRGGRGRGRGGL